MKRGSLNNLFDNKPNVRLKFYEYVRNNRQVLQKVVDGQK